MGRDVELKARRVMRGGANPARMALLMGVATLAVLSPLLAVPQELAAYTLREPIFIDRNGDFTAENGVTGGSGTDSDPYVIEGWEIDASGAHGIEIRNTDAHVIIRDVYVHSGGHNYDGVVLHNVSNALMENSTVSINYRGVFVRNSTEVTFKDNHVSNNNRGIDLIFSSSATFTGNNVSSNLAYGIVLYSSKATITGNSVSGNDFGVWLDSSTEVTIEGNTVSNNGVGIGLTLSTEITIKENSVSNNTDGISVDSSTYATITGNVFTRDGVEISGDSVSHFNTHTITPDNLVNGKPIYYHKDCAGLDVNGNQVGQLIVVNCSDVRVANLQIVDAGIGIEMAFVEGALITGNNISKNGVVGVYLYSSSNALVTGNNLSNNDVGVWLDSFTNANITRNSASNNDIGIELTFSADVTIRENDVSSNIVFGIVVFGADITISGNSISNNGIGVSLPSNGVLVHHNDFIDNRQQATVRGPNVNIWDDGYPSGGNYWSDYTGADECSGPNQDTCPDPDGIGDTPYRGDRYPLMEPYVLSFEGKHVLQVSSAYGSPTGEGWYDEGSVATISLEPVVDHRNGTRHVFVGWTGDVESTETTIIVVMDKPRWVKANWKTQYLLTIEKSPSGGVVDASSGWFDEAVMLTTRAEELVEIVPGGTRLKFTGWTGDVSSGSLTITISMDSPRFIIASWIAQHLLQVSTHPSGIVVISGEGWYDQGVTVAIGPSPELISAGRGVRHVFTTWTLDGLNQTGNPITLTVDSPHVARAEYRTQYYLTVESEMGSPQGEGWYDEGSTATFSITPPGGLLIQEIFSGWSDDSTSTEATATLLMNSPKTVTATWRTDYTQLLIVIGTVAAVVGAGVLLVRSRKKVDGHFSWLGE